MKRISINSSWVISTTLSSSSLVCSFLSYNLLFILCSVFFYVSCCIIKLFLVFCVFSLLNLLLYSSILLLSPLNIFNIITSNSLLGRLLILHLLHMDLYLCHLILPNFLFYFFILGRLVMIPDFGEVALCWRYPMGPRRTLPVFTGVICSGAASYVGFVNPLLVAWPATVGMLVGRAGSLQRGLLATASCIACFPLVGGAGSQHSRSWGL